MPTVPVKAAGWRIEPPVSVAGAPRQSPAATAAAEPAEEPTGTNGVLAPLLRQGEMTGPKNEVSFDEPMANSSWLSLPSMTAPSRHRLAVTVDSYDGTKLSRICEQAVVLTSAVQKRSLIPIGMPSRGPAAPVASLPSEAFAIARAR